MTGRSRARIWKGAVGSAAAAILGLCGALSGGCQDPDGSRDACRHVADHELTVFSNNVGIFPDYLVALYPEGLAEKKRHIIQDEEERSALYAAALLDDAWDADLLLLQEIWSVSARDVLIAELAVEYPHVAHPEAIGDDLLQPSGLMVFSKHALHDFAYHVFTRGEGVDKLSDKGVIGVRLAMDGREIAVFVTHLQAGGKDDTIRPDQLGECAAFIHTFTEGDQAPVTLLAGDLNISSNGSGYQAIFDALPNATDTYLPGCSALETTARYADDPTKRIDYLLTFDGVDAMSTIVDPGGPTLADHLSVVGAVSLQE